MVTVAFVCVHNAGRSQMAAAFARAHKVPGVVIISGGTDPGTQVNPVVVEVMKEKGIDISGRKPSKLTYDEAVRADYFITMGCSPDEACPAGFRGDVRDWELADPKGKSKDEVRKIRDEVERRVGLLMEEIAKGARPKTGVAR